MRFVLSLGRMVHLGIEVNAHFREPYDLEVIATAIKNEKNDGLTLISKKKVNRKVVGMAKIEV